MIKIRQNLVRWLFIAIMIVLAMGGTAARTYRISAPIADWHSWRQADTAAVARNYVTRGIDLLHPRYDDLSNIQSGKDNPQGYRMVEFPLYQAAGAALELGFPTVSLEVWLRILSIICSVGTGVCIGLLVKRKAGTLAAVSASALYLFLPYSIYYGRTILPDVPMVFFAVLCLYFSDLYFTTAKKNPVYFAVSAVFGAATLLSKPVGGFLLLPVAYQAIRNLRFSLKYVLSIAVWGCAVLVPFLLWRNWISHYPEGVPAFDWLFNKDNIRFKGAWFQWLFAERIGNLILGYWGLVPFGLGIAAARRKTEGSYFLWLFLGSLAYLVIIAGGNVQHDYYQIMLLPVLCVYAAKGLSFLTVPLVRKLTGHNDVFGIHPVLGALLAAVSVVFAFMFSWYTLRTYYWINRPEIVEAGQMADRLIPKNAKVIAPYNGDTTFLYQTRRQGWPIGFEIDKKIKMGAGYYVTVSPTDNDGETKDLASRYTVLVRNDKYAIIDLTRKKDGTVSSKQ